MDLEFKRDGKYCADKVVEYIHKYVEKNDKCYEMLNTLVQAPILQNEFSEQQWYYILEHAWKIAYKNAMEDNHLTHQERIELNNINTLGLYYKNKSKNALVLKNQIYNNLHQLQKIDNYAPDYTPPERKPIMPYPKPTPFNTGDNNIYDKDDRK